MHAFTARIADRLGLEGVLAHGEVVVLLGLLGGLGGQLGNGQAAADGAGLLLAEVDGLEVAAAVGLLEARALGLVVDREHAGDGLADDLQTKER